MPFESGAYRYTLDQYVKNVREAMLSAGCTPSCVDNVLTSEPEKIKEAATNCGCSDFMLEWNSQNPTLAIRGSGDEDTEVNDLSSSDSQTEKYRSDKRSKREISWTLVMQVYIFFSLGTGVL